MKNSEALENGQDSSEGRAGGRYRAVGETSLAQIENLSNFEAHLNRPGVRCRAGESTKHMPRPREGWPLAQIEKLTSLVRSTGSVPFNRARDSPWHQPALERDDPRPAVISM